MTIGGVIDALCAGWRTALDTGGYTAVLVFDAPPADGGLEYVYLNGGDMTKGPLLSTNSQPVPGWRRETWKIVGEVVAASSGWQGDDNLTGKVVRDRAQALLTILEANRSITGMPTVSFTGGDIDQRYTGDGTRICGRMFELSIDLPVED